MTIGLHQPGWYRRLVGGTNTVRVGQKGRIVLPAAARKVLDAEEDSELILIVRDREVVLMSKDEAERQLQEMFAGAPNLVDELIAERHAEAAADLAEEKASRAKRGVT